MGGRGWIVCKLLGLHETLPENQGGGNKQMVRVLTHCLFAVAYGVFAALGTIEQGDQATVHRVCGGGSWLGEQGNISV